MFITPNSMQSQPFSTQLGMQTPTSVQPLLQAPLPSCSSLGSANGKTEKWGGNTYSPSFSIQGHSEVSEVLHL